MKGCTKPRKGQSQWVRLVFLIKKSVVESMMQNSEKLFLKWNDFQENLNSAFEVLRNDQDFADVTLVCEDGTQIETHKTVLASSSPFFMEILKKNKHPHPMIYMRGLKAEAIVAMVDFLYYGEANVNQESLDVFLGLAEELRLSGLTGSSAESSPEEFRKKAIPPEKNIKDGKPPIRTTSIVPNPWNISDSSIAKTESSSAALVSVETHQLDEQIKSMMTMTEKKMMVRGTTQGVYACNVCGKEDKISNIKTHIEANHIDSNISHSCDICGKISRSRDGLRQHKNKEHLKLTSFQN